jgi:signal transduction histidine kinase
MDTFTLAATSFTIALSVFITDKKDRLHISFAAFCMAVCVAETALFSQELSPRSFWADIREIGILAMAPPAVWFFLHLTRSRSYLTQGSVALTAALSAAGVILKFSPLGRWLYFPPLVSTYALVVLAVCYAALVWHVKKLSPGPDKRRLKYLLVACAIAAASCVASVWGDLVCGFPPVTGLVLSALLYFTLLVVAYPQLSALHDYFARALIIFVSTLTGAFIFYTVAFFFSPDGLSFTSVLMAAFLIVISVTPVRIILKKIFSFFYPDSKNVFTSLYEFDEKLEREKSSLLAEMAPVFAHEIRNPLGSIKGAAQYLASESHTDEHKKLLGVIIEETNRLNTVVSRFLDYARPFRADIQPRDINTVIRRAISVIAANRPASDITIIEDLQEGLPAVKIDEQQFIQVIINIALNAIEAMPDGGTLTFSSQKVETDVSAAVEITVGDTGAGIEASGLKNIFKPFYTTKDRGVGLGLAICQKIIKEHGGSIRARSQPGRGSVFYIRLDTGSSN